MTGKIDIDWSDIVEKYRLPMSKETLRKACSQDIYGSVFVTEYFKRKKPGNIYNQTYYEEQNINKDGSIFSNKLINIHPEELSNPTSLLLAHGFNPKDWCLITAKNSIWNVNSKSGVQELYSSKITVKPRTDISYDEISEFYEELVSSIKPPSKAKSTPNCDSGLLYEIPIQDLHYGKFASGNLTNNSYSPEDAERCFQQIIDEVIADLKYKNVETILMPIGNDLLHFDNVQGSTTKGTSQDTNMRHQELYKNCTKMLISGIDRLSEHAPVEIIYVPGNHDFMSSYHIVMTLWAYYHNNDNVIVNTDMHPRKYYQWGNSLIGFAHGDKEGRRLDKIMQVEAREAWGRTKYHEWHCAHLHSSQSTSENGGVIIKNLPSVTGEDNWTHESGFVGAIRRCICFVWDKKRGLKSTLNIVIDDDINRKIEKE